MLESLITSKTRIKLLLKFFLNSENTAHLRSLASEFGESSNAIRLELNRFEEAGLLTSYIEGNKKIFHANPDHPLFHEIQSLVRKNIGIDSIVEKLVGKCGDLYSVRITGNFAKGLDSNSIEFLLIGNDLNMDVIDSVIRNVEKITPRKINFITLTIEESTEYLLKYRSLLLWSKEPELTGSRLVTK
jgi:hypothetical protein